MASQAEIANQAVLDVGGKAISDYDNETSEEAKLIRNIWDITRDEVMSSYEWGFAIKFKALALESFTMIDDKWEYAYALPSDYLTLLKNRNDFSYEIREGRLYANSDEVIVGYVARIEDTSKYPIWFNKALIARLRARIPIPLAKRSSKTADWYSLYAIELKEAQTEDARNNSLVDSDYGKHLDSNDTWLQATKI